MSSDAPALLPRRELMPNRFCPNCGAKLLRDANFCAECGAAQRDTRRRRMGSRWRMDRYAPLLVALTVLVVGGGAVISGLLAPKPPPSIPGRGDSQAATNPGQQQQLPEGHPPVEIPQQVRQAIADLAAKAAAAPDDLDTWKHLAEVQYRAGQLDPSYLSDAASAYRHVLEKEPENLDAMRSLGNIAFDQNASDIAIGYYQRYLKTKPDDLNVKTDLGTMYLSASKADDAIREYEAVMQADPKFFQAQFNLAIAYRSAGQDEKAMAALEKASSLATDDRTRDQVSQLLARLKGLPPPAPLAKGPAEAAAPSQPTAGSAPAGFQADAEGLFRQNPILGPKVQRIEWTGAERARVYLRDFPIDQMGDAMKSMFVERMRGRIKEKKDAHQVTQVARFELVDEPTGTVMESITE